MTQPIWYFDFISPFAYFQFVRCRRAFEARGFVLKPVLFAGLLKHWEHKGPAEIGAKRRFTYRYAQWYAQANGIAFRMPPAHPFPPLAPLRLAIALGSGFPSVGDIFDFYWRDGLDLSDDQSRAALLNTLGAQEIDIGRDDVKRALQGNTDEAIAAGVFGVPTAVVDKEIFWGVDATEMLFDYLDDRLAFESEEMRRVKSMLSHGS